MENKPSKWGFKVWVLAIASCYIQDFQISGDDFILVSQVPDENGKSGQVVLELSKHLHFGTHLSFDNYFASPLLLLRLKVLISLVISHFTLRSSSIISDE